MELETRLKQEKDAVARLLGGVFGRATNEGTELGKRLDKELGDQIRFDHRDVEVAVLEKLWSNLPAIDTLIESSPVGVPTAADLPGLSQSTYAFRLLTLAHILAQLDAIGGDRALFEGVLAGLGHGMKEVVAYKADFVR